MSTPGRPTTGRPNSSTSENSESCGESLDKLPGGEMWWRMDAGCEGAGKRGSLSRYIVLLLRGCNNKAWIILHLKRKANILLIHELMGCCCIFKVIRLVQENNFNEFENSQHHDVDSC